MDPLVIIDRGGTPRLASSRINVYDVVHYLEYGHSANYIALVLRITLAETKALIAYIEEHKEEVMAVHRKIEERIARGNPPEVEAKVRASHAKLLALRAELERKRLQEESNGEGHPQ
ncbi:MAG TPA: DUF433 domain-containing protein [Gemmataceae bacterium]|jgi:uncharacterized protein (DUF433 family)